jgi:16S rRNA processing protein RimM
MIDQDRRVLLGRIATAHGIRGEVIVESYAAEPGDIAAYGPLESEDGKRKFELKVLRVSAKGVVARIAGVGDRNAAEALRGTRLYIDRARLPSAGEDEFYHADLIGLSVEDESGQAIGTVAAIVNYGAGDLLEFKLAGQNVTELVPFTNAFVPVIEIEKRRVVVLLPAAAEDDEGEKDGAGESGNESGA